MRKLKEAKGSKKMGLFKNRQSWVENDVFSKRERGKRSSSPSGCSWCLRITSRAITDPTPSCLRVYFTNKPFDIGRWKLVQVLQSCCLLLNPLEFEKGKPKPSLLSSFASG